MATPDDAMIQVGERETADGEGGRKAGKRGVEGGRGRGGGAKGAREMEMGEREEGRGHGGISYEPWQKCIRGLQRFQDFHVLACCSCSRGA